MVRPQHTAVPKAAKIIAVCTKPLLADQTTFISPFPMLCFSAHFPLLPIYSLDPHVHRRQSNGVLSCSPSALCLCLHLQSHGSMWSKGAHEPLCAPVQRGKFNASDGKPLSCGPPNYGNSISPLSFLMLLPLTRIWIFFFLADIHPVTSFQNKKVLSPTENRRATRTECSFFKWTECHFFLGEF